MKKTERETQIYQYIVDYMQEHMYAPTIREICKAVGLSSTASDAYYMEHLAGKGLIEIGQDEHRIIRLVGYSIVPNSMIEELNRLRAEREVSE